MSGPAYRVLTERLVLRCWEPADAPRLARAIEESVEHLRPWMPWVRHEPEELDARTQRLRRFRAAFDEDRDYVYAILDSREEVVLGGTGLHPRVGEGAREIGYWIHAAHVGRGYATEAAAALTRVAFDVVGVKRVEIHCDPLNAASAAVPRKLGFRHDATLRARQRTGDGEPRDTMVWSMFEEEFAASAAAATAASVRAFGARGERLL